MSNYIWKEAAPDSYRVDCYYTKKFSLAWTNWELNKQEERLLKQSKSEIRLIGNIKKRK
jgi:hypothetical protein